MKLYGIARRKLGKTKMKVCLVDADTMSTTTDSLEKAREQLSDLARLYGHTHEYVLVTFTGEEPL